MNRIIKKWCSVIVLVISCHSIFAQTQTVRYVQDISTLQWKLWLDKKAEWRDDKLFLQPYNLKLVPVNTPSCGWNALRSEGKTISLPATVEEYFWGENGHPFGISGDYVGVSWFSTEMIIPGKLKGKRILLSFESVRMRAEIYINEKLAGYDIVNGTPFEVDITELVDFDKTNRIAVRITDPNGNFEWRDYEQFDWGQYKTPPSHGFGGITGKVSLVASDKNFIDDVFIKNKPGITDIDLDVTLTNQSGKVVKGKLNYELYKKGNDKSILLSLMQDVELNQGVQNVSQNISFPKADQWSLENPNLYLLKISWLGEDGSKDMVSKNFGFRWFEIKDVAGDRQFYLNNKRIVLRTSISWGFWPVNGIYPTPELAKKQIQDAKKLGINMLNFHRGIGQTILLDYADELGLLYYAEPGGFGNPPHFDVGEYYDSSKTKETMDFYFKWRRDRLFRMIKSFRSHPSLVIYNYINERNINPNEHDVQDMKDAQKLDPTRIMTFTSTQKFPEYIYWNPRKPIPLKMHTEPYKDSLLYYGWWDEHHAAGPGLYHDGLYNNPKNYERYTDYKSEIIHFGEEGANGCPARYQLIRDEIFKTGKKGWDGDDYLKIFDAYDKFLTEKNYRKAFPNVDSLTVKLSNVSYYYQGKMIENIRMNNLIDGYTVNGWEDEKLENHSAVVDCYRNLKGDPSIISYYNKPLYIAVKIRDKVLTEGDHAIVDFFIINENDVKGNMNLLVTASNQGKKIFEKTIPVKINGGVDYGQLIADSIVIPNIFEGYTDIKAVLIGQENKPITEGSDKIFAVKLNINGISKNAMLADDVSGNFQKFFKSVGIDSLRTYKKGKPDADYLIYASDQINNNWSLRQQLLDWVMEGHTLIIVSFADKWMDYLAEKEVIDYRKKVNLGTAWIGGNFFVRENPLFEGLPVNCAFDWEYQCFAHNDRFRYGFVMNGEISYVGAVSDHKQMAMTSVGLIPLGRGQILFSTLDIFSNLKTNKPSAVVAKKLLLNYLKYASKQKL